MRLKFDKSGKCEKCGGSVSRMQKTKTWHHNNDDDYRRCGYVKINRNENKGVTK